MFTKKNTFRELVTDPRLAPYAGHFISGQDLTEFPFYEMTVEEISRRHYIYGYLLLNSFNRLLEAVGDGNYFCPLYSEEEIRNDPGKAEACFLLLPSMDDRADERPFLVCVPGGGNTQVWNMSEGFPIAAHFNQLGYHAVVLNYRHGGRGLYPAPLEDMARLLQVIEARKDELHLNAGHYFTAGFSAGGYVVNSWGTTNHGYAFYGLPKPVMNISVYGFASWRSVQDNEVAALVDSFGIVSHDRTVKELAASDWNVEDHVDGFPPSFILHGDHDRSCDYQNSLILADALEKAGIPYRLEIGKGMDHGFCDAMFSPLRGWPERAVNFLNELTASEKATAFLAK